MSQTIKKTYRSAFTGQQIDEILASIQFKVDSSVISNEFSEPGNPLNEKKISSAELANILNEKITNLSNPEILRSIIEQIDNSNIYTDPEKTKLESLSTQFKGVFVTKTSRNATLSVEDLNDNDITMIIDDGNGLQAIQYWDSETGTWITSKLIRVGDVEPATMTTAGIVVFTGVDISKYRTSKFVITTEKGNSIHTKEVLLTYSPASGGSVYCVSYGDLVSSTELFNVSTSITGNTMNIMVETLTDTCIVYAQKLCEF